MKRTEDLSIGAVTVKTEGGFIVRVTMGGERFGGVSPLLEETFAQLRAYLAGERRTLTLPLRPAGTPFQQAIWAALREIPYGETRTCARLAAAAGHPRACRAAGSACGRNPIPLLIPCHRAVGSGGLGGFSLGEGIPLKEQLLLLEREHTEERSSGLLSD